MLCKRSWMLILLIFLTACALPLDPVPTELAPVTVIPQVIVTPDLTTEADTPIAFEPVPLKVGYGVASPWLDIYFTDPASPEASARRGGPNQPLAEAIHAARLSVDVAVYSLNLWNIRDALIDAYQRGVAVRIVMESDNMDAKEVQQLIEADIPIVGDDQQGLMHDKFVVIDRQEVWLGSMNFTVSGAYADNNNLVRIRAPEVAQDYTAEFNEMFVDDLFGPKAVADTPYPKLEIDGMPVEVYFSPDDHAAARVVELLNEAKESIHFLAFSFTRDDFAEAIIARAQAGLDVQGIMEREQVMSNQGTEYDRFAQAGIDIRLDGNLDGLMHHKVFIIDRSIVITGSYNFSQSAEETNDENLVIFFSPDVAAQYLKEFQRVYDETNVTK